MTGNPGQNCSAESHHDLVARRATDHEAEPALPSQSQESQDRLENSQKRRSFLGIASETAEPANVFHPCVCYPQLEQNFELFSNNGLARIGQKNRSWIL
jgi:hypothetical protein